jgi:hypothetical protein
MHIDTYYYDGYVKTLSCTRTLSTNRSGKINGYKWSGEGCPYTKAHLYKQWVNPRACKGKEIIIGQ